MISTALDAERTDLLAQLAEARAALTGALLDLSDEQLGAQPAASTLCLGGLVKHVASMEEAGMRFLEGGASAMGRFDLPAGVTWQDLFTGTAREYPQWMLDHQNAFRMLPGDTGDGILSHYRRVAERTEQIVASVPDLSSVQPLPEVPWYQPGESRSGRRALMSLIHETAQHAGHAQIIRESLDGTTAG